MCLILALNIEYHQWRIEVHPAIKKSDKGIYSIKYTQIASVHFNATPYTD